MNCPSPDCSGELTPVYAYVRHNTKALARYKLVSYLYCMTENKMFRINIEDIESRIRK